MFGQFLCAANGQIHEFSTGPVELRIQPVKGALAFAPRLYEFGVQQQRQMGRNSRLTHARDFLQFIHRQLIPLQQRDDAQARGVGESAKRFER